jgi:hypothetical protein
MAECCDPVPYRRLFNSKEATRRLDRYRRRGLDARAAAIVGFLADKVGGMEVLDVGGGVGEIPVELLEVGASRARIVELSDAYDSAAAALAEERGVADRVERTIGDFVAIRDEVAPTDVVVLNRVVCCYPHMERMMTAAVERSGRYLGVVVPRDRWWNRAAIRVGNAYTSLRKCSFEAFVHATDEIDAVATAGGMAAAHRSHGPIWQTTVYERA